MKIANPTKLLMITTLFVVSCVANVGQAFQDDLDEMRSIQRLVQNAASKNMESCVAISDGVGFGSGVIVSADGLILTAGHVMGSGSADREYEIHFASGKTARAKALGKNLNVDAGMVQLIGPGPWPHVELAEDDAQVSDWIICLGHSGGYELGRKPPVRTGRVLGIRGEQIVSDAVLIGGDSGGPLFDLDGKLIGIHSSIGDTIAENRHVSISTFKTHWSRMLKGDSWGALPELASSSSKKKKPSPSKPKFQDPRQAKLGVVVDRAADVAKVTEVRPGSPADRVGIRPGDVIKTFEGRPVTGPQHLIDLVKTKKVGDSVTLRVLRGTYELNYQIILDVISR